MTIEEETKEAAEAGEVVDTDNRQLLDRADTMTNQDTDHPIHRLMGEEEEEEEEEEVEAIRDITTTAEIQDREVVDVVDITDHQIDGEATIVEMGERGLQARIEDQEDDTALLKRNDPLPTRETMLMTDNSLSESLSLSFCFFHTPKHKHTLP